MVLELWAPIAEAPGYDVSTWGRVRRGEFDVASWPNAKGYHLVSLEIDGRPRLRYVHRLVLSAFVEPPAGRLANHDDGRKGNNELENLEWTTPAGNVEHAWRTGLIRRKPTRTTCRHGHPLEQPYHARGADGTVRRFLRCARCRRANYRRARDRAAGFLSLLDLLHDDANPGA